MARLAIEIQDAELVVADEAGVVWSEPGCAVVEPGGILTGAEAYGLVRLRPRDTSFTHWSTLSIERDTAHVPGGYSTAELAHAQLRRLWQRVGQDVTDVIFVVPGTFTGESLGVLLGLAEECGIPGGAIVDAAVAASVRAWPGRQLIHVDAGRSGLVVTPLEQADRVIAGAPLQLDGVGLAGLMDAFARRIAELFVLATRYDPFHRAETEQHLYDALPEALARIDSEGQGSVAVELDTGSIEVDVERSQLLGAVQGYYRAARQFIAQTRPPNTGLVIQLSDRLAGLPGFEEELGRLDGATVVPLEPGFAARAVLAAADALALPDPSVKLFRHLPWREAPAEAPADAPAEPLPSAPPADEPLPTHVVYAGIAYPVNGESLTVGRSQLEHRRVILIADRVEGVSRTHCELAVVDGELRIRDLSSFGTFVNERRVDGEHVLKAADVIRVGSPGAELTVVRVEVADGA